MLGQQGILIRQGKLHVQAACMIHCMDTTGPFACIDFWLEAQYNKFSPRSRPRCCDRSRV